MPISVVFNYRDYGYYDSNSLYSDVSAGIAADYHQSAAIDRLFRIVNMVESGNITDLRDNLLTLANTTINRINEIDRDWAPIITSVNQEFGNILKQTNNSLSGSVLRAWNLSQALSLLSNMDETLAVKRLWDFYSKNSSLNIAEINKNIDYILGIVNNFKDFDIATISQDVISMTAKLRNIELHTGYTIDSAVNAIWTGLTSIETFTGHDFQVAINAIWKAMTDVENYSGLDFQTTINNLVSDRNIIIKTIGSDVPKILEELWLQHDGVYQYTGYHMANAIKQLWERQTDSERFNSVYDEVFKSSFFNPAARVSRIEAIEQHLIVNGIPWIDELRYRTKAITDELGGYDADNHTFIGSRLAKLESISPGGWSETRVKAIETRLDNLETQIAHIPKQDLSGILTRLDNLETRIAKIKEPDFSLINNKLAELETKLTNIKIPDLSGLTNKLLDIETKLNEIKIPDIEPIKSEITDIYNQIDLLTTAIDKMGAKRVAVLETVLTQVIDLLGQIQQNPNLLMPNLINKSKDNAESKRNQYKQLYTMSYKHE